jgi:hypothetical protein
MRVCGSTGRMRHREVLWLPCVRVHLPESAAGANWHHSRGAALSTVVDTRNQTGRPQPVVTMLGPTGPTLGNLATNPGRPQQNLISLHVQGY